MQKKENGLRKAYLSDRVLPAEWIAVGIIAAVLLITFSYVDLSSLTVWSTNLLDVIWEGRIGDFYAYSAENIYGLAHQMVGCEITALIPMALWNIPIWIMQRFFGMIITDNYLMLLWSHLYLAALLGAVCLYVHKICLLLTGDKTKSSWAVILTASSVFTYASVFYAAQNDVLYILLALMSVYALLRGSHKWFYICAAISVSVKPFFLFAYIALVLLTEKNILKIIGESALAVSVLALCKLLFHNAPMYAESMAYGPTSVTMESLFSAGIEASYPSASVFIILLVIIYFLCYTAKTDSADDLYRFVPYICTSVYLVMLTFAADTFYRPFVLIPFMIIMFITGKSHLRLNMLLAGIMNGSWLILLTTRFTDVDAYNLAYTADNAVMRALNTLRGNTLTYYPIGSEFTHDFAFLLPVLAGVAVACAILILIINYPSDRLKLSGGGKRCERWIMWLYMYEFAVLLLDFFRIYLR